MSCPVELARLTGYWTCLWQDGWQFRRNYAVLEASPRPLESLLSCVQRSAGSSQWHTCPAELGAGSMLVK